MRTPTPTASPGPSTTSGVGRRIRAARLAAGMTQEALASAVGVSRSAVAQWETDRSGQVGANLARVAAALGVSTGHLLSGDAAAEGSATAESGPELALLRLYRGLSEADRAYLLRLAILLARQGGRAER